MLHPTSEVQWMDIGFHKSYISSIADLFSKYSFKANKISDTVSEILFDGNNIVKVTDWFGWTDVLSIRKIDNVERWNWVVTDSNIIYCSPDTLLPVYSLESIKIGFHGEVKYSFIIKEIQDLTMNDDIRVRREDHHPLGFVKARKLGGTLNQSSTGYKVLTKSGFFNCNNFYLCGRDSYT